MRRKLHLPFTVPTGLKPILGALFCATVDKDQKDVSHADRMLALDATLKAHLADLANQPGQRVDDFVEALLRRVG